MIDSRRPVRWVALALILGALAIAAASCSNKTTSDTSSNTTPPPAESSGTASAPAMNDAEIAAIVVAANTADIDNGKEAQSKSKNADVKMLGRQMVNDHSTSNRQADSLAKSLSLNPQESETSRGIKAQQDSIRGEIKKLNGAAYDKAYVDNEVSFHETVLNDLDQTLIPNAQNPQLKDLLQNTRPIIAAHLEHAKSVQSKLGASASR